MINANEELPYEQQMLYILRSYDRIVDENRAIKAENARLREELKEKEHYEKCLRHDYDAKKMKLDWVKAQLKEHLKSHGVKLPKYQSIKKIVELTLSN